MMRLRRIGIDTQGENVAFLARRCTVYRAEDFQALAKVEVTGGGRALLAVLNIVDDRAILGPDELGLSQEAFGRLGIDEGSAVSLAQAAPPASLEAVRRKIEGRVLDRAELEAVMHDVAQRRYSKMEIAAFLVACASFMTTEETLALARAMAAVGTHLVWDEHPIVDKHCIGGIPGNRTSMIVVPIVAAHGLPIPKTSSRAITSPAGTADTMEVLANVDLGIERIQALVREQRGCLVWGGHVNLSPADDVLISVERPLGIDTREQMVASIMSKKQAAGSTHLVIDIPLGPTAKVRSHADAIRLRKLFEYVGGELGMVVDVVITDGSQPIGRGVGPVLEAADVMAVLRCDPQAPADLRERALFLAGRVLEFDPRLRGGAGPARAREMLESGAALAAMERIIAAQGPAPRQTRLGRLTHEVGAPQDGTVQAIDCWRIARIARLAGAPFDKGAGILLMHKVGGKVRRGAPLYRIHAEVRADLDFAVALAVEANGYTLD